MRSSRPIRHKFFAKSTERGGLRFDSKKEARRWDELQILKQAGEVVMVLRQVSFDLPGNTKYRIDFQIFWANGEVTFEDVKGMRLPAYVRNVKQVEALYPVKITEV